MGRLVLGTAQWGAGYGVTSQVTRIADAELARIMKVAVEAGITAVDTAPVYGDAQSRLRPYAPHLEITTKVPGGDPAAIAGLIEQSLDALGQAQVQRVLLHDWDELDDATARAAARALEAARQAGLIREAGVSIYEAEAIERAIEIFDRLDAIQVPANALDRRLEVASALAEARSRGVRIAVRSVFLQGLLAGPSTTELAEHPAVLAFHAWAEQTGRSPLAAALDHARAIAWAEEIVVGVTNASELTEIITATQNEPNLAPDAFASTDINLIDPRRWSR